MLQNVTTLGKQVTYLSMLFHNFTQVANIPNALSEGFMKKDVLFFDKLLDNDNV